MSTKRKIPIHHLPSQIVHRIFVMVDLRSHINLLQCCSFSQSFIESNVKRRDRISLDQLLRIDVRFNQITFRRFDDQAHFLFSCDLDYNGELPDFGFNLMRFFSVELKGDVDSRAIDTLSRLLKPQNILCEFLDHPRLEYHLLEKFCSVVEALDVEIRIDPGKTIPNGNWHLKIGPQKLTIFTENLVDFNVMELVRAHNNLYLLAYGEDLNGIVDEAVEEFLTDVRSKSIGINETAYISKVPFVLWKRLMTSNNIEINEVTTRYLTERTELQLIPHNTEKYVIGVISTRWNGSEEATLQFRTLRSMEDLIYFLCSHFEHSVFDFSTCTFSNGNTMSSFEPLFHAKLFSVGLK